MTDLANLFVPRRPGPAQQVTYRQGRIVTWNVLTAENTVDVGGTELSNLPILNTSEALLLAPGDVVSVLVTQASSGGASTYAILGRVTIPGTALAGTALNALGQYIMSDNVNASDTITSTSFAVAPTNPGPEVTVDVRASGRVLVLLSALLAVDDAAQVVHMGFALSGATTYPAINERSVSLGSFGGGAGFTTTGRIGASAYVDGLTQGSTTFTAQYRRTIAAGDAGVADRNLTVIPL